MIAKRIIPCLDIMDGKVVKGKRFGKLQNAGDAVELAKRYHLEGADELVFLDISATVERRKTLINLVREVAKEIFIPFTVGGGISSVEDMQEILMAGADKVSINTAAVENPIMIAEAAKRFGSQCIVVAIDAKKVKGGYNVFTYGGRKDTGIDVEAWAKEAEKLGAGEILLTSIDRDGVRRGFDVELTRMASSGVSVPVIASGGAGEMGSFAEIFCRGNADAALAASVFHYQKFSIFEVKKYLSGKGIEVRE